METIEVLFCLLNRRNIWTIRTTNAPIASQLTIFAIAAQRAVAEVLNDEVKNAREGMTWMLARSVRQKDKGAWQNGVLSGHSVFVGATIQQCFCKAAWKFSKQFALQP
jgi:predicted RNA-binding protein with PIN domain